MADVEDAFESGVSEQLNKQSGIHHDYKNHKNVDKK